MRERLALHFDAEATLESRVPSDGYEVHIRMPYRTANPPPQPVAAATSRAAAANVADRNSERTKPRARTAPRTPEAAHG